LPVLALRRDAGCGFQIADVVFDVGDDMATFRLVLGGFPRVKSAQLDSLGPSFEFVGDHLGRGFVRAGSHLRLLTVGVPVSNVPIPPAFS
jgi:hypothetical protein